MLAWVIKLVDRHGVCAALAAAALLALPSLGAGLAVDDHMHEAKIQNRYWVEQTRPRDIFNFVTGDPAETQRLKDAGIFPWYTASDLKLAMWRPLTAWTHWLDYTGWPRFAWLMHLQNIFYYLLFVGAAWRLYRRVLPGPTAAALAAFLFAIDEAHAIPVGWLANRNALLAALFGVLAVERFIDWRERRAWTSGAVSTALVVLALLSGESGITLCAFLFAYVLCLEAGPWLPRVAALIPAGAVVLMWRIAYVAQGYGTHGSDLYSDPALEPLKYLATLPRRYLTLASSALGPVPPEVSVIFSPTVAGAAAIVGVFILAWFFVAIKPLAKESREVRFWLVALAAALLPFCATEPTDRLLTFPSVATAALVATVLFRYAQLQTGAAAPMPQAARALAVFFVVTHVVIAPLSFAPQTIALKLVEDSLQKDRRSAPLPPDVRSKRVVIVNPGGAFHAVEWCYPNSQYPLPAACIPMTFSARPVQVARRDAVTLTVRMDDGYMADLQTKLLRSRNARYAVGDQEKAGGVEITVTDVLPDGTPREAQFRFPPGAFGGDEWLWLAWDGDRYVRFVPPDIGKSVALPAGPLL